MDWARPPDNRADINRAGQRLREQSFPITDDDALKRVNAWRSAHSYPLNTFQVELRRRARLCCGSAQVAQRIKRLESIHLKLSDRPSMRLTQMQDIAGCRAILMSPARVERAAQTYLLGATVRFNHTLHHEKDYMLEPKSDGYRSRHLIFQYETRRPSPWAGLFIEIQLRTKIQHAWATAVESVGTFTREALKSNRGDERWRRFFALTATALAAMERQPSVPGTEVRKSWLVREIAKLEAELSAVTTLEGYQKSLQIIGTEAGRLSYYVISLNFDARRTRYIGFRKDQSQEALEFAAAQERAIKPNENIQVVLVAAGSIKALKRAYPNYILDTTIFVEAVKKILAEDFPDPQPAAELRPE